MSNRIELLSPARDLECGRAAIRYGADAIYIGAERFGARANAGNSVEDIAALAREAHLFRVNVYATINTLLRDDELPEAVRLAWELHEAGVDGIIVQDMGLLEYGLPPMPLIASTQAHNATPEKVAFLERVGFQRAILARELDLDQIRAIRRAASSIELECFVHGALCVGYSGQCYLSYAMGGRSGNRGECAQPCRKRYSLFDETGRTLERNTHLLSLHDLNLSEHLGALIEAGATSLKIEGRLKDELYVGNVTAYYRQRLDAYLKEKGLSRSSSGETTLDFVPDVNKTFHRGFTTYFLRGRRGRSGRPETPKMLGEPLGRVTKTDHRSVTIETTEAMHPGDGVCFFNGRGELCGTSINEVKGQTIVPESMAGWREGIMAYRNHDHAFLTRLRKSRSCRRIAVTLTLRDIERGLALEIADEDGVRAEARIEGIFDEAEKPEQALATMERQLRKLGASAFTCAQAFINLSRPCFVPVATLNALRRDAIENLVTARLEQHPVTRPVFTSNDVPYPETELAFSGNVLNRQAEAFYRRHGVTQIEPAAESGLDLHEREVMTTRYCIRHQLGLCKTPGQCKTPPPPLTLVDEEGHAFELRFDCAACVMRVFPVG